MYFNPIVVKPIKKINKVACVLWLPLCCFLLASSTAKCCNAPLPQKKLPIITINIQSDQVKLVLTDNLSVGLSLQALSLQQLVDSSEQLQKKVRRVASILAFPLFGIVGLHRIYLGTKPYIPIVYVVTIGGCFGILPLIDFFILLSSTPVQIENYKNNPHIFMWIGK